MKTTGFILLVLTTFVACAQTQTPSQPVTATVDASKICPAISPYIYGQFLEHAGSLIYNSLWSEMLEDRKFYYPVMSKPKEESNTGRRGGFPGRRNVGPGRWNPIGPVDSVIMDKTNPFVGDHTPLVEQRLKLNIIGTTLSGQGTLWQLASTDTNGQNPSISKSPLDLVPDWLTLSPFSVSIYNMPVR